MNTKLWVIQHAHRHGFTVWPVHSEEQPTLSELGFTEDGLTEEDAWVSIEGPWDSATLRSLA